MTNPFSIRERISRCLGWMVAICLFNSIIDMPNNDFVQMNHSQQALNEIETVAEWFLEEVADIYNAIPEQEEEDNQQSFLKDKQDWLSAGRWVPVIPEFLYITIKVGFCNCSADNPYFELNVPPPELCS